MHIVYTERHKLHATEDVWVDGQPLIVEEVPARVEIILEAVRAANLGPVAAPTDHGMAPILAVHDAGFVEHLRTAYTENAAQLGEPATVLAGTFATRYAGPRPTSFRALVGYYAYGAGAPILAGTWEAAYWSAQCALSAADLVRAGERAAYALCRPPGHHAAQDLYGGFCYLNNVAIAARRLHSEGKVAILDIDYHHGNGTQAIFYTDPAVLYGSLHADPDRAYPYYWGYANERGAGPGEGTNYNWPLPRGTGDADYLATLDQALATIRRFKPRFCVVSVGYDTAVGDAVGGFNITTDGFRAIGEHIAGLGLPTLLVQEGGYRLDTLGENAAAFLKAFSTA